MGSPSLSATADCRSVIPRLGIASFRTGTEALHGVARLGVATVFPHAVGLGATWDEDPLHTARLGTAYCRGPAGEYDLVAFRPIVASGSATGAMAAYNLVNGRPCRVSPLIEDKLRCGAGQTGHEPFVVSDEEAPCNPVELEHYFEDHAASHAAALKSGIDSFTDHREDSATVIGRLREALERGLIEEEDVSRAVCRQLQLRFLLGEFDPDLDPYADIGPEMIDRPEHRTLALRAATEPVVLLKNDGLLPLDPQRAPRIAVIGPHVDALYEDWCSGTMPYQVGIATGLRAALGDGDGHVVRVLGAYRIRLLSRTSGKQLFGTSFDVQEWGDGVLTLCDDDTGGYLGVQGDVALVADRALLTPWFVDETFRPEPDPDAEDETFLLRNVRIGRYAGRDTADGRVRVTAESPETAERWQRELLRDGQAEARAAAEEADVAIVVLGNHPMINGRETEDRTGIDLPEPQEALLRAVAAVLDRIHAASDRLEGIAARRRAETLHNDIWTEPLFAGRHPAHEAETWAVLADGPWRLPGDLDLIGTPLDFLGVNFYRPLTVAAAPHRVADPGQRTAVDIGVAELDPYGTRQSTMGRPVVPSAFTELLCGLHVRYPQSPPIWITENGSAEADTVAPDGRIHDPDRIGCLAEHLAAVADAMAAGVDVRGYYAWSLLDNFEWARGYDWRFGLVHVDYDTLTRTPKDSYRWYRGLITAHRARTEEPAR